VPRLRRLVDSHAFTTTILVVIIGNAVVLGLQTYPGIESEYGDLLVLLNGVCLAVFVVELTLRIASYWPRPQTFFREAWNVFDFVIIAVAFVPGLSSSSTLLRLARLARVVRIVRLLPELRVLLRAVMHSLPPLFSMMVMTALILFVYGMVGWSLFGDEIPRDWGNIGEAMLTLFVMLTLENFPVYMDRAMEIHPWSWIYFVSFILVAALIVLNVLIGIVLNSMEEVREIERRRKLGIGEAPDVVPAPVAERITILRAALDELEQELAVAQPRSDRTA
jgi:voltage-gated sodium channel